jgi:hypothetical protein
MAHKPMNQRPTQAEPKRLAVFGGHRAGKRKRGTSVTKVKPVETTHALTMDVHDAQGSIVELGVRMVTTRPNRDDLTDAQWNGLDVVPLTRSMPDAVSSGKRLGTSGNVQVRRQVVHVTKPVDCGAVVRFVNVCDAILSAPIEHNPLPLDYVAPKYAKVKPIPTDRFGRE